MTINLNGAFDRVIAKPYRVRLDPQIQTTAGLLSQREGWFVQWHRNGNSCVTELAPLPGFSHETLQLAFSQLIEVLNNQLTHTLFPSTDWCIGIAQQILDQKLPVSSSPLPNCQLISSGEQFQEPLSSMRVKIKLDKSSAEDAVKIIKKICEKLPESGKLRVDLGGRWCANDIKRLSNKVPVDSIDYIEEPFSHLSDYKNWLDISRIPFALDRLSTKWHPALNLAGLKALVLKPQLLGYQKTLELINLSRKIGLTSILSSCYESNITLSQYAALARREQLTDPQGLDTAKYWSTQFMKYTDWHTDSNYLVEGDDLVVLYS